MTDTTPVKVGVIGCGNFFGAYARNCPPFPNIELAACADLDLERAQKAADEFGLPKSCSVDELLADDEIEIVINLTIPAVHAEVNMQILKHGKKWSIFF